MSERKTNGLWKAIERLENQSFNATELFKSIFALIENLKEQIRILEESQK